MWYTYKMKYCTLVGKNELTQSNMDNCKGPDMNLNELMVPFLCILRTDTINL